MAFEKGNSFGTRSSRKGVENKTTTEVKNKFRLLIEDNLEKLQTDLNTMKSVERFNAVMQLAKYVIPTLKAVEVEASVNNEVNSELVERLLKIDEATFNNKLDNE
jgi:hypothetical protein